MFALDVGFGGYSETTAPELVWLRSSERPAAEDRSLVVTPLLVGAVRASPDGDGEPTGSGGEARAAILFFWLDPLAECPSDRSVPFRHARRI